MNELQKITRRSLGGGAAPAVSAASSNPVVIVAGKKHRPVVVMIPYVLAESLGVVTREQVETCPRIEPPAEE